MAFSSKPTTLDRYRCRWRSGSAHGVIAGSLHALCSLVLILTVLLSTGESTAARVDSPKAGEYQVKAAFILNFINFIEWPETALSADTFTIGVLGRDPFEGAMDSLKGKSVKGRRIIVRHYDFPEEARDADILFISQSEKRSLPQILKTLRNRPVLTIGDHQGFARSGVMINLVLAKKRVGFEINLPASQKAGIRISSQLLKLSKEVVE